MTVLFSRQDASSVAAGGAVYEPDDTGAFTVPDAVADALLTQHVAGEKAWETQGERQDRLAAEDLEHRRDPATQLAALERLGAFDALPVLTDELDAKGLRAKAKEFVAEAQKLEAAEKAKAAEAKKAAAAEKAPKAAPAKK